MKFLQNLGRNSNIKFNDYSLYGSKFVPFGRRDITKLIVACRIFETPNKNRRLRLHLTASCQKHT